MAEKECIEREVLIADVCERCKGVREPCDSAHHCLMLEVIYSVPAADVRPVARGKWKPSMCGTANGPIQDRDEWYGPLFLCSECGADMIGASNFCPNCGADMREES